MLRFGFGNSKLIHGQIIIDLPAGWSCPFAKECLAKVNPETGRIQDGPQARYRCYAATGELRRNVRNNRWHNYTMIRGAKSASKIAQLIIDCLPYGSLYRIHSSGDFFSQDYFDAWLKVANNFKDRVFYAYTKALPFWVKRKARIPVNLKLVASYGGTHDHMIEEHGLRYAKVVFSIAEAEALGLPIDHDDTHAFLTDEPFCNLLHNTQKAGTEAAAAWQQLKGISGYSPKKQKGKPAAPEPAEIKQAVYAGC